MVRNNVRFEVTTPCYMHSRQLPLSTNIFKCRSSLQETNYHEFCFCRALNMSFLPSLYG
jgi:hypothetical protein